MPHKIATVLASVLKRTAKQQGVFWKIQRNWRKYVGQEMALHTKPVSLRRGRLVIHADRPGDSFTISYKRAQILKKLQVEIHGRAVDEIVVRPKDAIENTRSA